MMLPQTKMATANKSAGSTIRVTSTNREKVVVGKIYMLLTHLSSREMPVCSEWESSSKTLIQALMRSSKLI